MCGCGPVLDVVGDGKGIWGAVVVVVAEEGGNVESPGGHVGRREAGERAAALRTRSQTQGPLFTTNKSHHFLSYVQIFYKFHCQIKRVITKL